MTKKSQLSQAKKISEHFREHPYYKLCLTVFHTFEESYPTMVMTPEQLFVDASKTLDRILQTGDPSTEQCQRLWNDTYRLYRDQDGTAGEKNDSMAEVAMLFYMVMYGVAVVNHSHYQGTIQRTLHTSIAKYWGQDKCFDMENRLRVPVNKHTEEMWTWMKAYFTSSESLTKEINVLFIKKPGGKNAKKSGETVYYTLPYNCPNVSTRVSRVNIVMQKMVEWKWIEDVKIADDFDHFFNGEPRNCNLKWIGKPTAILSELLKQLLDQHYMSKTKGVSARSIVINQFGLNPSGNKERIDATQMDRINMIKYILDYKKPLPLPPKGKGEEKDISDLALQAVYAKVMHITKDLNRTYE